METAQHLDRFGHRFRREKAGAENAFSEASYLPVFVNRVKASAGEPSNLQANGVGTDINRSKGRHGGKANSLHAKWYLRRRGSGLGRFRRASTRSWGGMFGIGDWFSPHRREHRDGVAELRSGHVMQLGD